MSESGSVGKEAGLWMPSPWIAGGLGFFSGSVAFLYTNSAKWFFIYSFGGIIVGFFLLGSNPQLTGLLIIPIIIHSIWLARKYNPDQHRKWYSRWWGIIISILLFALLIVCFRAFLYEPFRIPAGSMLPTLKVGDIIVVKKWGFGSYSAFGHVFFLGEGVDDRSLKRGGLYVFKGPRDGTPYVKRLYALPQDRVQITGSDFLLNGKKISTFKVGEDWNFNFFEESVGDHKYTTQVSMTRMMRERVDTVVNEGHVFFLGDNRSGSLDSRHYGAIPMEDIIGEVVWIIV